MVAQWIDQRIVVTHAKEYNFGSFSDMINELFHLRNLLGHVSCYMVDSSAPEVVNTIRREMQLDKMSERGIKDIIASCRQAGTPLENRLKVVPRFFNIEGRRMLQHAAAILSSPERYVAVPRTFSTLVQALQSATAFEWKLDKTSGQPGLDVLDSFIMALSYFRLSDK